MAVVTTVPNHYKYLLKTKVIDEANDTFKAILMNTTFAFNKDTHALLADVTADQLATGNGYTQNSKTLSGVAVTEDDVNDKASTVWADVTWTASGGDIGPTGAAIIYDDTVANDPIVMCIDFGADFTTPDGFSFQLQAPGIDTV
jgi:hypothetical protein